MQEDPRTVVKHTSEILSTCSLQNGWQVESSVALLPGTRKSNLACSFASLQLIMKHSLDPPRTCEATTLQYKYGYGHLVLPEKTVDYLKEVIADKQTNLFSHTIEELFTSR